MDHQPNILIVDDSAIVRKALTRQLEQFGAHVTQAEDGKQGVEVALSGHFDLTAVADTYHALTSARPYRRGMSHEQAMDIIEDVRGTQLCPDCVDAFKEMIK
jgi:response regulator RpfG family c-di-GMP phosphodiesterase